MNDVFLVLSLLINISSICKLRSKHHTDSCFADNFVWQTKSLTVETQAVWPNVGVKSSPNVAKSYSRSSHSSFYIRVRFFKLAQKVTNILLVNLLTKTFKNRPIWSHWTQGWCESSKTKTLFLTFPLDSSKTFFSAWSKTILGHSLCWKSPWTFFWVTKINEM